MLLIEEKTRQTPAKKCLQMRSKWREKNITNTTYLHDIVHAKNFFICFSFVYFDNFFMLEAYNYYYIIKCKFKNSTY